MSQGSQVPKWGRKEETCHGCLPCLPPIPRSQLPLPQNLKKMHCLSSLLPPSLQSLQAALTPSPSRAIAFACSLKQPASPPSTWRASPYYAGFPCCRGPQGPLSSRDLQQLIALPLSPLLCLELSEASTPHAFGDGMMKGMKQKPGFRYLLLSRQH